MMHGGPIMLRLASRCPTCGRAEQRRLFSWERDRWTAEHPDRPIETVRCDRCGTLYIVLAKHYQGAAPDRKP